MTTENNNMPVINNEIVPNPIDSTIPEHLIDVDDQNNQNLTVEEQKRGLAEDITYDNDMSVDEGVELIDTVIDSIIAGTKKPIVVIVDYDDPVSKKTRKLETRVKAIPNDIMIGERSRLKKLGRLDHIEEKLVEKYWVNKDGVPFGPNVVSGLSTGLIDKIYEQIKKVSNIDDSEMKQLAVRESIKN